MDELVNILRSEIKYLRRQIRILQAAVAGLAGITLLQ